MLDITGPRGGTGTGETLMPVPDDISVSYRPEEKNAGKTGGPGASGARPEAERRAVRARARAV